jgi:hypothetical protein
MSEGGLQQSTPDEINSLFPIGRFGNINPAIIFDRLFVAIPLPNLEYSNVLNGAMSVPRSSDTMYAQIGKVMFCVETTTAPSTKLATRISPYHHHGTSLYVLAM